MKNFTIYVWVGLLLMLVTACQSKETSATYEPVENESSPKNEKADMDLSNVKVSFYQDDKKIASKTVAECSSEDCSNNDLLTTKEVDLSELTEGIESTPVKEGDPIYIEVSGEQPARLSYTVLEDVDNKDELETKMIDNKQMIIQGDGKQRILVTLGYGVGNSDHEEFRGVIYEGIVLEVK